MLAIPLGQRLLRGFGEAEVDGSGEILFRAVDAACREQFLRTDHAHPFALLTADQVLAAFAAGEGQIGGAILPAAGGEGKERGVFVVRMGRDVEDFTEVTKLFDLEAKAGGAGEVGLART